jgi:hypothetical protein
VEKLLKHLVIILLFLISFIGNSAELVWSEGSQLNLDQHVEFTVSDNKILAGDE